MLNNPNPQCGILYVDDEEKALKYFRMAFAQKFKIFIATSGAEGIELLRRESANIGIVVSDQRMPGMLGAEFLGMVRQEFPVVVRILTTAYSDLDSAIQAVNQGHIYQYVVKPWEITEFGMVLSRAANYYQILTERNELLALKMTALQRMFSSDRLKWLLLQSRSLASAEQSAFRRSLSSFIKALPMDQEVTPVGTLDPQSLSIGSLIQDEYSNATRCLDWMTAFGTGTPGENPIAAPLEISASPKVTQAARAFVAAIGAAVGVAPDGITLQSSEPSKLDVTVRAAAPGGAGTLVRRLFGLLAERETTELSVRLFEVIYASALEGNSLSVSVEPAGAGESPRRFDFSPTGEPDSIEGVIDTLSQKFAEADISRI